MDTVGKQIIELEVIIHMEYVFENDIALEVYYLITKELKIKLTPKGFEKRVYLSERFLMTCLTEIYAIKEKKSPECSCIYFLNKPNRFLKEKGSALTSQI